MEEPPERIRRAGQIFRPRDTLTSSLLRRGFRMSVVLRCPSCSAKLRLDESPPLGTMIDCPKCGTAFPVRNPTAEEKPKAKEPEKPGKGKKTKTVETKEREFMNEFALLGIVGGAMLGLMLVLGVIWFILNRAAKVEDLIATVPESYSALRGVNLEQMRKMPGYKPEVESVFTKEMQAGYEIIAKGLGIKEEKSLSYLLIAYNGKPNGNLPAQELYIFRIKDKFDPGKLGSIENIRNAKDTSGRTYYGFDQAHENPFLQSAVVECPTRNLVMVTRYDPNGVAAAEAAALANGKKTDGMQKKIGDIGRLAAKAHFWTILRADGVTKDLFAKLAAYAAADKEMMKLSNTTKTSPVFASWATFGSAGLRCGVGIECTSSSEAKELAKFLQDGPLGKGDESEPPNYMRQNLQLVGMKKVWGEFTQSMSFNTQGNACFVRTKSDNPDNMRIVFDFFSLKDNFLRMFLPSGLALPQGAS
jgi:hypothetical protein